MLGFIIKNTLLRGVMSHTGFDNASILHYNFVIVFFLLIA